MMRSLYSGISGLKNHQTRMDVIGNNIANVNTIGYKTSRVIFQDIYSQTLKTGSAGTAPDPTTNTGGMGGTNPLQIGLGVKLSAVNVIHTSAPTQRTDRELDFALEGDGFFVVQNPSTGTNYYTRAGNFELDDKGNLVTTDGYFVMGYNYSESGIGVQLVDSTGSPLWADAGKTQPVYLNMSSLKLDNVAALQSGGNTAVATAAFSKVGEILTAMSAETTAADALAAAQAIATTAQGAVTTLEQSVATLKADEVTAKVAAKVAAADAKVAAAAAAADPTDTQKATDATAAAAAAAQAADDYALATKAYLEEAAKYNQATAAAKIAQVTVNAVKEVYDKDNNAPVSDLLEAATVVLDSADDDITVAEELDKKIEEDILSSVMTAIARAVEDGTYQGPELDGYTVTVESVANGIVEALKDGALNISENVAVLDDRLSTINLAGFTGIAVNYDGTVYGIKDEVRIPIARVSVAMFANSSGLEKAGSSLYRETGASGEPVVTTPQNSGAGSLNGGGLEMSNVDLATEFTDMIVTQRGYQANSRVITVSDTMLEELVNLKR